jgi:predicted phage terminase large subunit-like protein
MTPQSELADAPSSDVIDAILRNDMASFLRAAFAEVSPGTTLVWGAYLDLISARLAKVVSGECRNLIITMPPRHLKSICVSVALPAFFLGHYPAKEILAISYGQDLAKKFAEDTRTLMQSEFYTRIFDTRLSSPRQSPHALRTTAGGIRRATSIEGTATGLGAELIIFDDPQKPNEALSEAVRRSTNQTFENTFLSRRTNPATCRTVIVMQRLHEDDFVGHVLGLDYDWEVLNLPAIAEMDEAYPYQTFMGNFMYRRAEGAALHPARIPITELDRLRANIGEAVWASQYMQRPAPAGGGLVNTAWFKPYNDADLPTSFDRKIQSWDTANTISQMSDFSVCTTWGLKGNRIYLLHVFRKRLSFPELKRAIREQDIAWDPSEIFIEDHASGTSVIQDLLNDGFHKVQGHKPKGDKQMRMAGQATCIENGSVYIPQEAHWLPEYLHELAVFPNGKHDDQVDSTSQALDVIRNPQDKSAGFLALIRRDNAANDLARGLIPAANVCHYSPGSMEYAAWEAAMEADAAAAIAALSS